MDFHKTKTMFQILMRPQLSSNSMELTEESPIMKKKISYQYFKEHPRITLGKFIDQLSSFQLQKSKNFSTLLLALLIKIQVITSFPMKLISASFQF